MSVSDRLPTLCGQKQIRVAQECYSCGWATELGNVQIWQQPLSSVVTSMCLVHALLRAERGSTRIRGPMSTKYEGISFPMTRTAIKLMQQREYEVMKIAVLKACSFISRFPHPILSRSSHCPQIQHEIHLKITQIPLKTWWLITCHCFYSQIRRSVNTIQQFWMLL